MEIYKEFIVFPFDYKKKIAFLSAKNVKASWTFDVDWSFPVNHAKPKMFLEIGNEDHLEKTSEKSKGEEKQILDELLIQQLVVSEAHSMLSFTCSDKSLFLCKISESSVAVISRRVFLRTASIIKFSNCGKSLILSDKTGDTFVYSCEEADSPGRWIFGHISQILDLKIKSDMSLIVTSDRDEKIRVTNYPATHQIEAFCVGHEEFVSCVEFFNDEELLLSASGDKTLRFWNFRTGKQVHSIKLHYVPITVVISGALMAILSGDNTLYIYSYDVDSSKDSTAVEIHLLGQKTFVGELEFVGRDSTFFIKHLQVTNDGIKKLQLDKAIVTEGLASFDLLCDVNDALNIDLDPSFTISKTFDVSLLFKKKFDNVKQYIDRKKARIENKVAKKN